MKVASIPPQTLPEKVYLRTALGALINFLSPLNQCNKNKDFENFFAEPDRCLKVWPWFLQKNVLQIFRKFRGITNANLSPNAQ